MTPFGASGVVEGVTEFEGRLAWLCPTVFVAVTEKVYEWPNRNPVKVQVARLVVVQVKPDVASDGFVVSVALAT